MFGIGSGDDCFLYHGGFVFLRCCPWFRLGDCFSPYFSQNTAGLLAACAKRIGGAYCWRFCAWVCCCLLRCLCLLCCGILVRVIWCILVLLRFVKFGKRNAIKMKPFLYLKINAFFSGLYCQCFEFQSGVVSCGGILPQFVSPNYPALMQVWILYAVDIVTGLLWWVVFEWSFRLCCVACVWNALSWWRKQLRVCFCCVLAWRCW